jgi:hypothetical protein
MNDEEIYTALFIGILEDRRKKNEVGYVEAFHSVDPSDSWLVRKLLLSRTAIAIRLGLARLTAPSGDAAPSTDAIYEYYTKNSPVREGLEDLKRIAADHDLPVLVLVFPHAWGAHADRMGTPLPELDEYPNAWVFDNARILGLCRELGFTCIDLTAKLYENPKLRRLRPERLFLDGCCHLGILGHKVMAWLTQRAAQGAVVDVSAACAAECVRPLCSPAPRGPMDDPEARDGAVERVVQLSRRGAWRPGRAPSAPRRPRWPPRRRRPGGARSSGGGPPRGGARPPRACGRRPWPLPTWLGA